MAGTRHHSNQELIGQGLANIVAPLFAGMAATGGIARTATNVRNGGTSPLSGIVHALTLVLILLLLAPLAENVPLATLAAILFMVAWNMSEVRRVWRLFRRAPTADVIILFATFFLTVFTDLVIAVNIGVLLAMMHFMRRMAESVKVTAQSQAQLRQEFAWADLPTFPPGLHVYSAEGPFFFGAAEAFSQVLAHTQADMHTAIIRMRHVPFVDATGLQALEDVVGDLQRRNITVLMTETNARVVRKMGRMGLIERIGHDNDSTRSAHSARLRGVRGDVKIAPMLQDLDSLAARLQQLLTRVQALKAERAQQQITITDLQRERETLRKHLAQSEAEASEVRAQLAQCTQNDARAREQHATELAAAQSQAARARAQWQQEFFTCQGERDDAVTQWQHTQAQVQTLKSAAQQAHLLVDTLLLRLPEAGEE